MHVSGHLREGSCSEQNATVNTLNGPQLKGGKWWPQMHTVTDIPRVSLVHLGSCHYVQEAVGMLGNHQGIWEADHGAYMAGEKLPYVKHKINLSYTKGETMWYGRAT